MTRVSIAELGLELDEIDDAQLEAFRAALSPGTQPVRTAFAAALIVMLDDYGAVAHTPLDPGAPAELSAYIDWRATIALRRRIHDHGFGIAEAMDTAQRFEIGWEIARRLIEETGRLELANGFVAGAGVDHLRTVRSLHDLVDGVLYQIEVIQAAGGIPIVLPLLELARRGASPSEYVAVYSAIVKQCTGPLLIHWLGAAFHPGLAGYFPGDSFEQVMDLDPNVVRGCKLSLLDREHERRTRARIAPRGQVVLTGDDFHFAELIAGESGAEVTSWSNLQGRPLALGAFSHALLGVFDAVAAPAGVALAALAAGDRESYAALMEPCEALGQHLFAAPTQHYKAGIAFLAWLDGHQSNPYLVNHAERSRDRAHYLRAAMLAAEARVFTDATEVAERLRRFCASG